MTWRPRQSWDTAASPVYRYPQCFYHMCSVLPYKTAIWLTLLTDLLCGKSWFMQAAFKQAGPKNTLACHHKNRYTHSHIPHLLSHTHHPQTLIGSDAVGNIQQETLESCQRITAWLDLCRCLSQVRPKYASSWCFQGLCFFFFFFYDFEKMEVSIFEI